MTDKKDDKTLSGASPAPEKGGSSGGMSDRKKRRWAVVFVLIAAASIWAVTTQWKDFSLADFMDSVGRAKLGWLIGAVIAMLGFIIFEALALRCACRALHYNCGLHHSCRYAAADIYFSAITPSATGGQPACAYLMMKDGIPGIVSTAVLLMTLVMYTFSILVLGLLGLIMRPSALLSFGTAGRILIGVGFVIQAALAVLFLMLIRNERLLEGICRKTLRLLGKLRLIRNEAQKQEKLLKTMQEYRQCTEMFGGQRAMLAQSFAYNLLQRASQIAVTMLVYLAMHGDPRQALDVFAMQSFVVIGSNSIPIPGSMGVADFMMLDGFGSFLPADQVISVELLSRAVSFYSCVLICGLAVLLISHKRGRVVRR